MLPYLKRCIASVADQGVSNLEHIIVDGGSTDGTVEWLKANPMPHLRWISEKDSGMYDAVNKGLRMAKGEILAYLNCDEQYLPRTLQFVSQYLEKHTSFDIIFGDLLLIRPDGQLVAFRKSYMPRWRYILTSHLYVLTCTMFFRRTIIDSGLFFDTSYKAVADAHFVVRVLRSRFKPWYVREYFAAFTITGKNMSINPEAILEQKQLLDAAPLYVRLLKYPLDGLRLFEKFMSAAYKQVTPLKYSVYIDEPFDKRKDFVAEDVSPWWSYE